MKAQDLIPSKEHFTFQDDVISEGDLKMEIHHSQMRSDPKAGVGVFLQEAVILTMEVLVVIASHFWRISICVFIQFETFISLSPLSS